MREKMMFNRVVGRALRRSGHGFDSGVAMVTALGMILIGAIVMTTLAAVTIYNAQFTLETRTDLRVRASADAGIDLALANVEGKTYADLHEICNHDSFVINNDQVQISYVFTLDNGSEVVSPNCIGSGDVISALRVESTATSTANLASGEVATQTVAALFNPQLPDELLDKAIFSEGSLELRNGTELIASGTDDTGSSLKDAHVYSNGGIRCNTEEVVDGKFIAAHGDVVLQNDCEISSDVWASGRVLQQASGSVISGNIYAASDATGNGNEAVRLQNGGITVNGSVLTNGSFFMANNSRVDGTVFARTGHIELQNSTPTIGGSAYAKATIKLGQGRVIHNAYSQTGNIEGNSGAQIGGNARANGTIGNPPQVGGTRMPNNGGADFPATPTPSVTFPSAVGYPTEIQPPPREQMPRLALGATDYPATVSPELAKWQAQGWDVVVTDQCTGDGPRNFVNNLTWSDPTMVIFDCANAVSFDNATLTLGNDLALVSQSGFSMNNDNWFRSTDSSQPARSMFMIVPSDAPGVAWEAAGSGQTSPVCSGSSNISIGKLGVQAVETMFYTPCSFQIQNGLIGGSDTLRGQIYAGVANLPVALKLQMSSLPVPSLATTTPSPDDLMDMRLASRFDLYGS